ncbi:MAG TPA: DMT family transporter, partial [Armatimonadetes bacterium]|nr:DMT family transporter [Armatimonadota bacterium]
MKLLGPLNALIAFAIFSTHDVFIKYLGGIYSPIQTLFFTALLSFPLITFMLMRDKTSGNLRPVHPWWIAARTCASLLTGVSAFYAFSVLPLTQIYVLLFTAPLLITLLAIPILGERVGVHRLSAVFIGLVGVVIVLRPGSTTLGLGHVAGILAAAFIALTSVIVRKIGRDERTAVMMLYPVAANFVVMGVFLGFVYKPMPVEHFAALGLISILGFAAGLILLVAYRNADAAIVAPMQYSQMLWATFFGYFLFDEKTDLTTWIGVGVIIASGIYIVLRESRLGDGSTTPVLRTRSRGPSAASFRISPMLRRGYKSDK